LTAGAIAGAIAHVAPAKSCWLVRPGSRNVTDLFFTELAALEVVALYKCQVVVAGDFYIHVERDFYLKIYALAYKKLNIITQQHATKI